MKCLINPEIDQYSFYLLGNDLFNIHLLIILQAIFFCMYFYWNMTDYNSRTWNGFDVKRMVNLSRLC